MTEISAHETVGLALLMNAIEWARINIDNEHWSWNWVRVERGGCDVVMKFKYEEDAIIFRLMFGL